VSPLCLAGPPPAVTMMNLLQVIRSSPETICRPA
jgi:hypothetical protein